MTRRPVYFDLRRIALPVGAVASFLHRVSGVLLVLALPVLAEVFGRSLAGPTGFDEAVRLLDGWWARLAAIVLAWALAHHLLAGVRHLAMDAGVGWRLRHARASAGIAIGGGLAAAALVAWLMR
ncbi:MAG: succinate dehydrogenase, cytochrome b556 subunit [Lautropia sp.]